MRDERERSFDRRVVVPMTPRGHRVAQYGDVVAEIDALTDGRFDAGVGEQTADHDVGDPRAVQMRIQIRATEGAGNRMLARNELGGLRGQLTVKLATMSAGVKEPISASEKLAWIRESWLILVWMVPVMGRVDDQNPRPSRSGKHATEIGDQIDTEGNRPQQ